MNAPIKVLIVDDEPLARTGLATLLVEHEQVEIIGMVGGLEAARALMAMQMPDLVFLDIEMPGGSGLELKRFISSSTRTIFVTAFPDYALRAFDFGASDYLVKPVDAQRLEVALARLEMPLRAQDLSSFDNYQTIHNDGQAIRLKTADILWVKAQQNYSLVRVKGETKPLLVLKTMADWEIHLPPELFERLDRSVIVNISRIQTVSWLSRDETLVAILGDAEPVQVGRTAAQRLKARLARET